MPELRWTLLILGALFIGGLALWEWRRQRHARGADGAPGATAGASHGASWEGASHGAWDGERVSPTFDDHGSVSFDTPSTHAPARGAFREPTLTFPEVSVEMPIDTRDRFADPPVVELDDESLDRLKVEEEAVDEFSEAGSDTGDTEDPSPDEPLVPKLSAPTFTPPTLGPPGEPRPAEKAGRERANAEHPASEEMNAARAANVHVDDERVTHEPMYVAGAPEHDEPTMRFDAAGPDAAGSDAAGPDAAGSDAAGSDAARSDAADPDAADRDASRFDASGTETAPGAAPPAASVTPFASVSDPYAVVEPIVEWPDEDTRKIVALRLVSGIGERFAGRAVRQALAAEGFVLGKFDIFHKPGPDARAVLSAASLTKPGTFSLATMDAQRFGGLSLFAVLPGPLSPLATFDELMTTARALNDRLRGALQDERGEPLTPVRSANIRESLTAAATAGAPVVGAAAAPPIVDSPDGASPA